VAEGEDMTEAEWLACGDPKPMLEFLRDKASDRKLRLFACACCRRIWQLLRDGRSRRVVEAAERFVDGKAHKNEWRRATLQAKAVSEELHAKALSEETPASKARYYAAAAAFLLTLKNISPRGSADWAAAATYFHLGSTMATHEAAQAPLLRCIAGNPFRPPTVNPGWLRWNGGTLIQLAQVIYDERTFDRLPILADALEDAGCTDKDILTHCRSEGPHVRGCWVVDLLLGKQ
jgi:hypothetical protein